MFPNFLIERLFWSSKIAKILQVSHLNASFLQTKSLFRIIVANQKVQINGKIDKICHVVFS